MSKDISPILEGWEFDPDQISVRIITGEEGREKIQLRLDLGLLQMELDGRPDGKRPEGAESWLDHYEQAARAAADDPAAGEFHLDSEACAHLLREGVQYYHRYISFWHLERFELCARDTARNLRLFAFVCRHAENEREKLQFDQFRPYVIMMYTRAVATPLVRAGDTAGAIARIDEGIAQIRDFLEQYNQLSRADQCGELVGLKQWRRELVEKRKRTPSGKLEDTVGRLQQELSQAVSDERFEEAARLRDEIRRLSGRPPLPFRPPEQG